MYLSVIIPSYNEAKNIENTVKSIYSYLNSQNIEHEIIVIVDGAKDNTADIVRGMLGHIPTLKLEDNKENHGKGYVVRQGMLIAKGDYRVFTDADNSTSIDHIKIMMPYFDQGYDVVIGSIGIAGAKVSQGSESMIRILAGKMGNLWIRFWAVPGIHDTQRGFKIVSSKAAQDIFSKMVIDRFAFDIEMLALARRFKYKIKEVPIDWKNDAAGSKVKLSSYINVLLEVLRIRWYLWTGKYK
jgi:dolichyl-phosphate beta-glucosyltransferase